MIGGVSGAAVFLRPPVLVCTTQTDGDEGEGAGKERVELLEEEEAPEF